MNGPYWWPGFGFMWIFPLVFLVVALAFLLRGGPGCLWRGGGWRDGKRESPREILDRRYANGEITKEQYEEMRRTLER